MSVPPAYPCPRSAEIESVACLVRYYWSKDDCLDVGPLEHDANIWGMLDRYPHTCALILADIECAPVI